MHGELKKEEKVMRVIVRVMGVIGEAFMRERARLAAFEDVYA